MMTQNLNTPTDRIPNQKIGAGPSALARPGRRHLLPVALACLLFLAVGSEAYAQAPRWEYCVRNAKLNTRLLEQMLNDYAAQGWELFQLERGIAVFRRAR